MTPRSRGRRNLGGGRPTPLRAPYRYADRDVSDHEFIQRVRRHTPSSLVAQCAIAGARFWNRDTWFKQQLLNRDPWIPPWALAEIARTSIIYGTDFGRSEATYQDLIACFAAYHGYIDPELKAKQDIGGFFLRMGTEQLSMQQDEYRDYARTAALFVHTQMPPQHAPKVMTAGWDRALLAGTVVEYVAAASLLEMSTSVVANWGRFSLDWLTMPQFEPITAEVPADVLRTVIEHLYVADRDQLRQRQDNVQHRIGPVTPAYRRFAFNPLTSRPVVSGLHDDLLIPVPKLIVRKASPIGIYYEGLAKWGTPFTTDLGHLFEAYIGRQLGLIDSAVVYPEISYGPHKSDLSVDWLVVFTDCVVLVEAKSCGPTEPIRLGSVNAADAVKGKLGRGVEQLNDTAKLIRDRVPAFEAIPSDRPILGLVATLDPFHNINAPLSGSLLPRSDIPYVVCSASEIEQWVVIDDASPGTALLAHFNDPNRRGWALYGALEGHSPHRNPILDEGWDTYPWRVGASSDDAPNGSAADS